MQDLLEKIRNTRVDREYGRLGHEGKIALLLGGSVKSLEREGGDRVDECVIEEVRK